MFLNCRDLLQKKSDIFLLLDPGLENMKDFPVIIFSERNNPLADFFKFVLLWIRVICFGCEELSRETE